MPVRAFADCTFFYTGSDGNQKRQKVERVTVRYIPPDRVLFRGIEFGEVSFGANENEFWVRVKPEWDSYWWGTRRQIEQCSETMLINPYTVTDAFGAPEVTRDWKLEYKGGYDVLTRYRENKKLSKRIYVDTCDYRIRRIEYYDSEGYLLAAARLSNYTTTLDVVIPSEIEVSSYRLGIKEYEVDITLNHAGSWKPSDRQRQDLFVRPDRDGFGHMYRLNEDCDFTEED